MLLIKIKSILLGLGMSVCFLGEAYALDSPPPSLNSAPLERLIAGNQRYLSGKSTCGWTPTLSDQHKRQQLANVQKPFAIILGCSDSRVPPEVIFDQRIGDLFVVRVAGNVLDDVVLGSIEYAVKFLNMDNPFILVLGHEKCGAVVSAIQVTENKTRVDNHIASIIDLLKPVILSTPKLKGHDFVQHVVTANVRSVTQQLKNSSPILSEALKNHRLTVRGARYDLQTGSVTIIQ